LAIDPVRGVVRWWGGEVDDEGVIRKICVVPKPYQQPHQPMFQPFSVSEATIRYTAQSDIVPVILTAYPPRLRPFRGSLPTLRWREMDSNCRSPVAKEVNPFREWEPSWSDKVRLEAVAYLPGTDRRYGAGGEEWQLRRCIFTMECRDAPAE
jgi:hypothetical protein